MLEVRGHAEIESTGGDSNDPNSILRCSAPGPGVSSALHRRRRPTSDECALRSVVHIREHVALGDVEISSRLIDGQFPDYERIIPRDSTTTIILGTVDLLRATRVAAVFARDNAHVVRLECTPPPEDGTPALGQVLVKATSAEMGDNVGQLDASVRGDAGQIAFNGRYLREALEVLGSPQVGLQLSGSQRPGVLRPVGDLESDHLHVIMPLALPVR